jgi:ubiquinol-cytochrome c reductase cytochrome c subunit
VRRAPALLALAGAALALAACSPQPNNARQTSGPYRPANGYPNPAVAPVTGELLFERDCGWCHGNALQGTPNGPSLIGGTNGGALTDFMLSTGRMPIANTDQKDALHQPSIYSRAEINALVQFVESFNPTGTAVPLVNPEAGSLTQGKLLYQANCAACHSATGSGGALATGKNGVINGFTLPRHGLVAPSLLQSSPTEVVEAIRTGPPGMPNFPTNELSNLQVNEIARYVTYLQAGPNTGGLDLARIGPVAEGAVAWVVGLGLLLLLVRWIGTSSRERIDPHPTRSADQKER